MRGTRIGDGPFRPCVSLAPAIGQDRFHQTSCLHSPLLFYLILLGFLLYRSQDLCPDHLCYSSLSYPTLLSSNLSLYA